MNEATGRLFTREEHLQRIQSFSLFSDVFASVVFEDISACQHVLRVFTGKNDLCLKKVKTQYTISKTSTKSARLDVLAEDTEGIFYVMEIQRRKEINHPRRIRFYRGMLDSAFLEKGEDYAQLPQLEIFYVSETDVLEYGETVCQVCTSLGTCSNKVYDDGSYITFINAQIDDHSEIAALMQYFKTADPDDDSQGALSERVRYLKCKEGGIKRMCEITEQIERHGREVGKTEGKRTMALNLAQAGMPADMIAKIAEESISVVQRWIAADAAPGMK